jgi:hypothetical protein
MSLTTIMFSVAEPPGSSDGKGPVMNVFVLSRILAEECLRSRREHVPNTRSTLHNRFQEWAILHILLLWVRLVTWDYLQATSFLDWKQYIWDINRAPTLPMYSSIYESWSSAIMAMIQPAAITGVHRIC